MAIDISHVLDPYLNFLITGVQKSVFISLYDVRNFYGRRNSILFAFFNLTINGTPGFRVTFILLRNRGISSHPDSNQVIIQTIISGLILGRTPTRAHTDQNQILRFF